MTEQRRELLSRLASASGFEERRELIKALEALDREAALRQQEERDLDWSHTETKDPLVPVFAYDRHTTESDWLGELSTTAADDYSARIHAEASLWYNRLDPDVKADLDEFAEQAYGQAQRVAGHLGDKAESGVEEFLEYVAFLNKREAASGLPQINQEYDSRDNYAPTPLPTEVFDNFAPEVNEFNSGAEMGSAGRAPMLSDSAPGEGAGVPSRHDSTEVKLDDAENDNYPETKTSPGQTSGTPSEHNISDVVRQASLWDGLGSDQDFGDAPDPVLHTVEARGRARKIMDWIMGRPAKPAKPKSRLDKSVKRTGPRGPRPDVSPGVAPDWSHRKNEGKGDSGEGKKWAPPKGRPVSTTPPGAGESGKWAPPRGRPVSTTPPGESGRSYTPRHRKVEPRTFNDLATNPKYRDVMGPGKRSKPGGKHHKPDALDDTPVGRPGGRDSDYRGRRRKGEPDKVTDYKGRRRKPETSDRQTPKDAQPPSRNMTPREREQAGMDNATRVNRVAPEDRTRERSDGLGKARKALEKARNDARLREEKGRAGDSSPMSSGVHHTRQVGERPRPLSETPLRGRKEVPGPRPSNRLDRSVKRRQTDPRPDFAGQTGDKSRREREERVRNHEHRDVRLKYEPTIHGLGDRAKVIKDQRVPRKPKPEPEPEKPLVHKNQMSLDDIEPKPKSRGRSRVKVHKNQTTLSDIEPTKKASYPEKARVVKTEEDMNEFLRQLQSALDPHVAASGLDQIQQVTDVHDQEKRTPMPEEVAFPINPDWDSEYPNSEGNQKRAAYEMAQKLLEQASELIKQADMWGASDMSHRVPGGPVPTAPGESPPSPEGSYEEGVAAGMADKQAGNLPSFSDASSSSDYVKGYARGYSAGEGRSNPKDVPYSLGGDNGQTMNSTRVHERMLSMGYLRSSEEFASDERFDSSDFRKGYSFGVNWQPGMPMVRQGSADFEAGLYSGITDNPDAQQAFVEANLRHESLRDRITAHAAFSESLRGSEGASESIRSESATVTDLNTMSPATSPDPMGATPVMGPGTPPPHEGMEDPARPGGPAPYNGAEPYGRGPVVPNPVVGPEQDNPKLAAFVARIQANLNQEYSE